MSEPSRSRAVITGASSGLGVEFARQLAGRGMDLFLAARRMDRLEEVAEEVRGRYDVEAHCIPVDLAEEDGPGSLYERAVEAGPVEVLVNNAGFGLYADFLEAPLERQLAMLDVNVRALTELTHRFAQHMREHGRPSHLVQVGSVAGWQPVPGFAVYAASKSYVRDFSEALAHELRDTDIGVTAVHPGPTRTEFQQVAGMGDGPPKRAEKAFMSAEEVVAQALRGMDRGRPSVVNGAMNKVSAFMTRLAPRRLQAGVAGRFVRMGT